MASHGNILYGQYSNTPHQVNRKSPQSAIDAVSTYLPHLTNWVKILPVEKREAHYPLTKVKRLIKDLKLTIVERLLIISFKEKDQ